MKRGEDDAPRPERGRSTRSRPTEEVTPGARDRVSKERWERRAEEDESYVPVIVKRSDESKRHPDDILVAAVNEGLEQLCRPTLSLGLSSIAAGLILGFTAMAVAVATVAAEPYQAWPMATRLFVAVGYPLGFVLCLMGGAELFTEHTATAVYPVLDRQASVPKLLRLWTIVAAGNLVGAFASAGLLTLANPVIGARDGFLAVGRHLVAHDTLPLFVSALLAGWLMALGAWLILATPSTLSQMMSIYLVTFLIGIGGLHHSIAGAVEIFTAALMSDELTIRQVARFLFWALGGNLVGGSLFVAVLNYAHIRETRRL